jgi:hypothetical protein
LGGEGKSERSGQVQSKIDFGHSDVSSKSRHEKVRPMNSLFLRNLHTSEIGASWVMNLVNQAGYSVDHESNSNFSNTTQYE